VKYSDSKILFLKNCSDWKFVQFEICSLSNFIFKFGKNVQTQKLFRFKFVQTRICSDSNLFKLNFCSDLNLFKLDFVEIRICSNSILFKRRFWIEHFLNLNRFSNMNRFAEKKSTQKEKGSALLGRPTRERLRASTRGTTHRAPYRCSVSVQYAYFDVDYGGQRRVVYRRVPVHCIWISLYPFCCPILPCLGEKLTNNWRCRPTLFPKEKRIITERPQHVGPGGRLVNRI
jgi:hypothetical protein